MTPEQAFKAGMFLEQCLTNGCKDAHDVALKVKGHSVLSEYLNRHLSWSTMMSHTDAVERIKNDIISDLHMEYSGDASDDDRISQISVTFFFLCSFLFLGIVSAISAYFGFTYLYGGSELQLVPFGSFGTVAMAVGSAVSFGFALNALKAYIRAKREGDTGA